MINRFFITCFFSFFVILNTQAQQVSFGCRFLQLISGGIMEQNRLYKEYLSHKGKVTQEIKWGGPITITGTELNNYKKKEGGKQSVYDDSIFHMGSEILLIDTFRLFTESCFLNEKQKITIVSSISNSAFNMEKYKDILVVKSIRCFDRYFIIAIQHINSIMETHFYFNLIANHPPKLEYIQSQQSTKLVIFKK